MNDKEASRHTGCRLLGLPGHWRDSSNNKSFGDRVPKRVKYGYLGTVWGDLSVGKGLGEKRKLNYRKVSGTAGGIYWVMGVQAERGRRTHRCPASPPAAAPGHSETLSCHCGPTALPPFPAVALQGAWAAQPGPRPPPDQPTTKEGTPQVLGRGGMHPAGRAWPTPPLTCSSRSRRPRSARISCLKSCLSCSASRTATLRMLAPVGGSRTPSAQVRRSWPSTRPWGQPQVKLPAVLTQWCEQRVMPVLHSSTST